MAVSLGGSGYTRDGRCLMIDPREQVAARIVERYGHPSRAAHLYLFRVAPGTSVVPLVPEESQVAVAWVDEGADLCEVPAVDAIARCIAAREAAKAMLKADPPLIHLTHLQRRRQMARVVMFSLDQQSATEISVDLFSRALAYTPKGDRRVIETWRPTPDGMWYSAPMNRD